MTGPVRTQSVLADGREILYFDDVERGRRPAVDRRVLDASGGQGEIRTDPLTGDPVVVAAHRQVRTHLPATDACPLCPGQEVPDSQYDVAVFENRWPSLSGASAGRHDVAAGRCEVLAYTDRHDASFGRLPVQRVATVVEAWCDRSFALGHLPDVQYVACFENRGEAVGVTLHHPHGQVYGYPFVPPVIERIAGRASRQPELFDAVLDDEARGPRVLIDGPYWLAYVPHASQFPYEVVVLPRRHAPRLELLSADERSELAMLLPPLFAALDRLFDVPAPYIAAWRQSPVHSEDVRAHLRITCFRRAPGKLKHLAGSETAYGAFVSDVSPEAAARALRNHLL